MSQALPFRLVLASGSVGRRYLMEQAGRPFEVRPSNVDEPTDAPDGDIRRYVHHVAWSKAAAVAPTVAGDAVVIAADSVGWFDGRVIGKPEDRGDARRILTMLAGTVHELWTGVVLWRRPGDRQVCWQEVSRVAVKPWTEAELEAYLDSNKWVGCSGAYAIEGPDDPYVQVVEGSFTNVVGLPMESLERELRWMRG